MPEPLDYRNPFRRDDPTSIGREPTEEPKPLVAVPVEFDTTIAKTDDHAAIVAIEEGLKRGKIDYFRSDNGERVGRQVELFVRKADADRGMQVAGPIFVRRQKLKSYPRQKPVVFRNDLPEDEQY